MRVFNAVTQFGVVGDGVTDDTVAAQNWLNAAMAADGLAYLPPGLTVKVTGLSLTLGTHRLRIYGSDSIIKNASIGTGSTAKCGLYVLGDGENIGTDWLEISNLRFTGSNAGGAGLYLDRCFQGILRSVYATGFKSSNWDVGIWLHQSIDMTIVNPILMNNGCALNIDGGFGNANCVIGGWLYNNTRFGAQITGVSRGNTFYNTIFQQNAVSLKSSGASAQGTCLFGGWVENSDTSTNVGLEVNSPGFLAEGVVLVRHATTVKIDAGASNVVIRSPFNLTNTETMSIASGAANVTLWDPTGTITVTDNSGGQYKSIQSYLLTGG